MPFLLMPLHGRCLHGGRTCHSPFHVLGQRRLDGTLHCICTKGEYSIMTSEERREARYKRRRARRQERLQSRNAAIGTLEEAFSYRAMFYYGKKCCNGVRWKQSTQNFELHLFSGTAARRRQVLDGTWKPKKCSHFILKERGKIRPIDAPHITDRQIHKTECNNILIPLYTPHMIYDNGASRRGMGLHFAYHRLEQQLHWHFRRYGRAGAVLLLDLKKFFPNAPHATIY